MPTSMLLYFSVFRGFLGTIELFLRGLLLQALDANLYLVGETKDPSGLCCVEIQKKKIQFPSLESMEMVWFGDD